MKIIFQLMPVLVGVLLIQSCFQLDRRVSYDPSREQFVVQLEQMYEKNIVDFFPPAWSDYSLSDSFGSYHSSSWDDSNESTFRCLAFFSDKVSGLIIDSLESLNYIEKIKYNDSVFIIDINSMLHASSYRTPMKDSLQIPIPDMQDAYFSLGKKRQERDIGKWHFTEEREILPEDLVVYVLEAGNGNYWKNKSKADLEARPVLSTHWKHGYAKGVAISRKVSIVCWWAMAW